ncbi:MAG: aminodeoxychorismate synthase component I [Lysobacteraceae bacterium]
MLIHPLPAWPDLSALQARAPALLPCLLESAARGGARARYDLLLAASGEGLCRAADGSVRDLAGTPLAGGFLDALDRAWQGDAVAAVAGFELPFAGGWALFLGYELAMEIEPRLRLPPLPGDLPSALALRCPAAFVLDHAAQRAFVVAEPGQQALLGRLIELADDPSAVPATPLPPLEIDEDAAQGYLDGVARVRDYLAAGDVFQVNLARRWRARFRAAPDPLAVYRALRHANPAPFGGLFRQPDWTLLSSSPERLVSRRGARLETRPIAGTRARDAGDDAARIRELVGHPKERAEHIMLIDLERNDLGRVSRPGSVRVEALMEVESYAHVHHIESTVSAVAREGLTPGELIRAVFPGGTITGCPKVRCMEIIAELEGIGRGPYTGALGWLDRRGDLDLNILIRSGWLQDACFEFRAGAGIVIDSDPDRELAETRAKARGLLRALGADG